MKTQIALALPALTLSLVMLSASGAAAQVATLSTPGPDAAATEAPAQEADGQEAILQFVACLRDNGIDIPDPQFGVAGGFFGGGEGGGGLPGIDFLSKEFLDAVDACQSILEPLQPELDAEQQAEQNAQILAFAECMRREDIDFPDPDPIRGLSMGAMVELDPFSPEFQSASRICGEELGVETPQAPGS